MRDVFGVWVQQRISAACFRCVAALRFFEAMWRNPLLFFGILENNFSHEGAFYFAMQLSRTGEPRWVHRWPGEIMALAEKATEDTTFVPDITWMANSYLSEFFRTHRESSIRAFHTYRILQGIENKEKYR